ncbi:hypothetical protein PSN45_002702 [Yamadazyma tenuis]|uniref:Uncharacterized protein n=1 Tax=Candida tenuis (strain ATCC 10573 / BCRC 21748 / CBS 615 / JCM 9827 / NBRC 10315 / NRRL Y-1498 / VKM Y-70) TaxID=590646 RepID=G3AX38_CANTC|nr:uncharacterized protein CANTEDRAFT_91852 [Yamadazyma tenuis ATCC 10573]EGV66681.1 hypothetical protein CANTEDRAFT_91852 [Yamadazyma tenuis ATCC 10573]WEJ95189.1 hypothetical protein PSN45_002702 [Yamadazyma tenuis]
MRSAIFDTDSRPRSPSGFKGPSRSRQPSPTVSTKSHLKHKPDPAKARPKSSLAVSKSITVNWNLDEMISAYHEYKALPPKLSPSLPTFNDDKDEINDRIPSRSLSQPSPARLEAVPSPTKTKIKWVNKLDESKPKFLLRFHYNSDKYKHKANPSSAVGLGISLEKKKSTPVPTTPRANTPMVAVSRPSTPVSKPVFSRANTPRAPAADRRLAQEADVDYIKMKTYWIKLAKETKFISNNTEGILSLIIELDSLILYAISYYFDDKSKEKMNIAPSDRYWKVLMESIDSTINKLRSSYLNKKDYEDINIYLKCLVGILHKLSTIILKRINSIYETLVADEADAAKKLTLQANIITNYKQADDLVKRSESVCPNIEFFIKVNFQEIWNRRCKSFGEISSTMLPMSHNYYLPLNTYTQLGEFMRFFYHLLNAFINIYNKIYNEDLIYSLKSGMPGP